MGDLEVPSSEEVCGLLSVAKLNFDQPDQILGGPVFHHRLSLFLVTYLELVAQRPAADISVEDTQILLKAQEFLQAGETPPVEEGGFPDYLVFWDICTEVKEYVCTFESLQVRSIKNRPPKNEWDRDYVYLAEAHEMLMELFNQSFIRMKRMAPTLEQDQVNLGIIKDYLTTGTFKAPLVKPEVLLKRVGPRLRGFDKEAEELFQKLGSFKNQVSYIGLRELRDLGVQGLRAEWRRSRLLMERISIGNVGVPGKTDDLFSGGFKKKISNESDGQSDEADLARYLKHINDFVCAQMRSPDYGGIPELEAAVNFYIEELDRIAAEEEAKTNPKRPPQQEHPDS